MQKMFKDRTSSNVNVNFFTCLRRRIWWCLLKSTPEKGSMRWQCIVCPVQSSVSVHHYICFHTLCIVNICQEDQFWAASLASGSSVPNDDRSFQTFWIQVERGLPGGGGLLQLSGSCTNRIRLVSANSFIQATCPNRDGGTWVIQRTALFLTMCARELY